jgi:hypothetical protein
MPDPNSNVIDWRRVYAEAVALALKFAPLSAKEIVHEGVTRYLSGEAPWAPGGQGTLAAHLVAVGRKVHEKQKRIERRRRSPKMVNMLVAWFENRASATPEAAFIEAEDKRDKERLFEELVRELQSEDHEALRVVRLVQEGVDQPREQAERLGMDAETLRNAHKRITRRVLALRRGQEES